MLSSGFAGHRSKRTATAPGALGVGVDGWSPPLVATAAAPMCFVVGDPLSPRVLQAAGLPTCARLVTVSPSKPPSEGSPVDGCGPLLARSDGTFDEANLMLVRALLACAY
jgi:hypothetical protein